MVLSTMEGDKKPLPNKSIFHFPSYSYLGLAVEIDCGYMVREAVVIQCNFQIN